jgi:hypothetical protein
LLVQEIEPGTFGSSEAVSNLCTVPIMFKNTQSALFNTSGIKNGR